MKCINSATPNGNPDAKRTEPEQPVKNSGRKKKTDDNEDH